MIVSKPAQQHALADAGLADDREKVGAAGCGRGAASGQLVEFPIAADACRGHYDHRHIVVATAASTDAVGAGEAV